MARPGLRESAIEKTTGLVCRSSLYQATAEDRLWGRADDDTEFGVFSLSRFL